MCRESKVVKVTFTPHIKKIKSIANPISVELIESETMLFSASPEFAYETGGILTRSILDSINLPEIDKEHWWVIDTRSHMLMPGMFPAIGGWHCDAVQRDQYDSQPDLNKMDDSLHYVATLASRTEGISNTEFITSELTLDVDTNKVWADVSDQVNSGNLGDRMLMPDGEIYEFTSKTIHRPTAATKRGWRWFFRCSCHYAPPENKIRHQVQVYTDINGGW